MERRAELQIAAEKLSKDLSFLANYMIVCFSRDPTAQLDAQDKLIAAIIGALGGIKM